MRQKLIDRIGDQIALAQASETGKGYQRVKYRRVRDEASDEVTETPVRTRVRPWWLEDKDGTIIVWIKYGNQTLALAKGKTAIRVKDRQELVKTFETVREAVRAGWRSEESRVGQEWVCKCRSGGGQYHKKKK